MHPAKALLSTRDTVSPLKEMLNRIQEYSPKSDEQHHVIGEKDGIAHRQPCPDDAEEVDGQQTLQYGPKGKSGPGIRALNRSSHVGCVMLGRPYKGTDFPPEAFNDG